MQLELKKLKFGLIGREGIRSFQCELFINGMRAAYVSEDGNGGCLRIHFIEPHTRTLIDETKKHFVDKGSDLDEQIINMVSDVEVVKEIKTKQKKHVCYRESTCKDSSYKMKIFGKFTIEQVLADPRGVTALTKLINELQADGCKILNTNFGSLQTLVK